MLGRARLDRRRQAAQRAYVLLILPRRGPVSSSIAAKVGRALLILSSTS
jgi:hypothetical protein